MTYWAHWHSAICHYRSQKPFLPPSENLKKTFILSCNREMMVIYIFSSNAEVAELVDAHDSGSCGGFLVLVRFQSSAPIITRGYGIAPWPLFL